MACRTHQLYILVLSTIFAAEGRYIGRESYFRTLMPRTEGQQLQRPQTLQGPDEEERSSLQFVQSRSAMIKCPFWTNRSNGPVAPCLVTHPVGTPQTYKVMLGYLSPAEAGQPTRHSPE